MLGSAVISVVMLSVRGITDKVIAIRNWKNGCRGRATRCISPFCDVHLPRSTV